MNNEETIYYNTIGMRKGREEQLYQYIKDHPDKRKFELIEEIVHKTKGDSEYIGDDVKDKRLMAYATLNRHLRELKNKGRIIQDIKLKTYAINLNYTEISEGSETQLKLLYEKELNKIRESQFLEQAENELWFRVHDKMNITYNFGEELKDKLFFSKDISVLIGKLFFSLMRECIIMNPELWHVMTKPEHFNFTFNLECNLQEDPKIFDIIKEIREKYMERKEVSLFLHTPFSRKIRFDPSEDLQTLELREAKIDNLRFKIDRSLEDLYTNAVGQDTLFRKQWKKEEIEKKEDFEGYIKKQIGNMFLNSTSDHIKEVDKLGEKEMFKEIHKERKEDIERKVKKLLAKSKKD